MATKDADQLSADFDAVRRDLSNLKDEFSALLGHLRSTASGAAHGVSRTAREQVHEHPMTTLLGAFVAGFITSLLFGRSWR